MNKLEQLRTMIRQMEDDLGIWGDIIGAIALFALLGALLWVTP